MQNEGSEAAKNVAVRLEPLASGLVTVQAPGYKILPGNLGGGETDTLTFLVNVGDTAGQVDLRSSIIQGFGINDKAAVDTVASIDNMASADLKPGARLVVDSVIPSQPFITAGDRTPWIVKVGVSNTGEADLQFVGISDTNVVFSQNDVPDIDYKIIAPTALQASGTFVLQAGLTDTLEYIVRENGTFLNQVDIDVLLKAVDLNTNQTLLLSDSGATSIEVSPNVAVGLAKTIALTNVEDGNGIALVNHGQKFQIEAKVQTGQFGGVDSVIVQLTTSGNSFVGALYDTIDTINRDTTASALFDITSDASWNFNLGEISENFSAKIINAVAKGDTTPVIPRMPLPGNDLAKVRIQTPSVLSYSLQVGEKGGALVEQNEIFDVFVKMRNLGRAPIGDGKITLEPPFGGYKVKNQLGDFINFPFEKQFSWPLNQDTLNVIFTMMAPDSTSGPDSIRTFLTGRPIDRNTDSTLAALGPIDSVAVVNTVDDLISIERFTILEPAGATDGTLSTDQTFTLQAVVKSAQNLQDRQAVLELPDLRGYKFQSPDQNQSKVNITSELDTVTWTIQAPNTIINEAHDFSLTVTGGVFGEDFATAAATVEIISVEKKTSLSLQKIAFDPAGVLKNDALVTFSTDQTARIIARVENDGADYEGTGHIEVFGLSNSNLQLLDGTERVEFEVGFDVEWNILAPPLPLTEGKELIIRVVADSVRDINSGEIVNVAPSSQTLTVFVDKGGTIEITDVAFWPEETDVAIDSVSSEQNFKVTAQVTTTGVKENDITAELISMNGLFKPVNRLKNIPSSGGHFVEWIVRAPNHVGNQADSLYVFVKAKDLQSELEKNLKSKSIWVPIAERTTFEFKPFISSPEQLRGDDKLSTGQTFSLSADIVHTGAEFDPSGAFVLRLFDPAGEGFELVDPATGWERTIPASDFLNSSTLPTWDLKAPDDKVDNLSDFMIRVEEMPHDIFSYQHAKVENRDVLFSIRTLARAQIYFDSYVHGDPDNIDATVRSGNDFEITAALTNDGESGLSDLFSVKLLLPDGFDYVNDDSIKTDLADTTMELSWLVRAPKELHAVPDTFWMVLQQRPKDKLAQTPAELLNSDTTFVLVTLEKGAIIVSDYKVRENTAVIRGRNDVPIMGLELKNKDASGITESYINGIRFSVRDRVGKLLSPGTIVSRIAAVRDVGDTDSTYSDFVFAEQTVFGDSGIIYLDFLPSAGGMPDTLKGNITDNIKLVVDIKPDAKMQDFRFVVDSLTAIDEFDIPLIIADSTEAEMLSFSFSSMMAVLVDEDLDKSFFNYPNPFGKSQAGYQQTKFTYYLKEPSDVKIHIYTLTGDLVKTWDISQAENEELTSEGLHQGQIIWDGRNGMGHDVLNGVYLAYILTGYGEQSMTKIAVIR